LKNVQNETNKRFLVRNTNINIQPIKANFVYEVLQNYPKINEFYSWNQQSRLNVNFCVANWKALSSFILDVFQISWQPSKLQWTEITKMFCLCRGIFL